MFSRSAIIKIIHRFLTFSLVVGPVVLAVPAPMVQAALPKESQNSSSRPLIATVPIDAYRSVVPPGPAIDPVTITLGPAIRPNEYTSSVISDSVPG